MNGSWQPLWWMVIHTSWCPESAGFFEQVGRNTGYIIHPDEILAENFVKLAIGISDPVSEFGIRIQPPGSRPSGREPVLPAISAALRCLRQS